MQIAFGIDIQIDQAVTRDLIQHVIEERHAGIQLLLTGTIDIDRNADLRLVGIARDFCSAWRRHIQLTTSNDDESDADSIEIKADSKARLQ